MSVTVLQLVKENSRLKRLLRRHRTVMAQMRRDGIDYTDDIDCVFCSGDDDYLSSDDTDSGEVRHSRRCTGEKAARLLAVEG